MQHEIGKYTRSVLPTDLHRSKQPDPRLAPRPDDVTEIARRRGDYRRLIATQETFLLRAALRLCRSHLEDAQDLTQETLVRGYEAFLEGRFTEGSNARAWFMRILLNLFLNTQRRRKWDAKVDVDSLISEGISHCVALHAAPRDRPDTALWMAALDEPLEKALAALPEDLRVCTYLVDIEEFTYAEAAIMLALPVGTVRSRLWRARRILHAHLFQYAKGQRRV